MDNQLFFDNYDKWLEDCKNELKDLGYSQEDIESFDICEDGGVFFGNLGFSGSDYVTRWSNSKYYME